jgi:HAD superfamily hydrolase (TIGR01458 family)
MKKIPPVLIDFDGIINIGGKPANDAKNFLRYLSKNKIPSHIISNSTLKTSKDVKKFLKDNSMDFGIQVMTAVDAAYNYVKKHYTKVSVYCDSKTKKFFSDLIDDENPEAVVIGDLGKGWTYEILNVIFRKVFVGAEIIAMQKNKYWKPDGKTLSLDAGPFINAIEFATGKQAILIGKPSKLYFQNALQQLGFSTNENFIMIGDDYDNDILAAQNIGGKGILVYTGKTKYPLSKEIKIKPSYEAQNLTGVISILSKITLC